MLGLLFLRTVFVVFVNYVLTATCLISYHDSVDDECILLVLFMYPSSSTMHSRRQFHDSVRGFSFFCTNDAINSPWHTEHISWNTKLLWVHHFRVRSAGPNYIFPTKKKTIHSSCSVFYISSLKQTKSHEGFQVRNLHFNDRAYAYMP